MSNLQVFWVNLELPGCETRNFRVSPRNPRLWFCINHPWKLESNIWSSIYGLNVDVLPKGSKRSTLDKEIGQEHRFCTLAHGGKDLKSNPEGGSGTSGLEPPRDHLHTLEILAKLPNHLKLASLKQCICRAMLWERE